MLVLAATTTTTFETDTHCPHRACLFSVNAFFPTATFPQATCRTMFYIWTPPVVDDLLFLWSMSLIIILNLLLILYWMELLSVGESVLTSCVMGLELFCSVLFIAMYVVL
jgi:hypothetical protein